MLFCSQIDKISMIELNWLKDIGNFYKVIYIITAVIVVCWVTESKWVHEQKTIVKTVIYTIIMLYALPILIYGLFVMFGGIIETIIYIILGVFGKIRLLIDMIIFLLIKLLDFLKYLFG